MAGAGLAYTVQDHVDHALHNQAFADYLIADFKKHPEYTDWVFVALAYSALHFTKAAILQDHNVSVEKHVGHKDHLGVYHEGHEDLVRKWLPQVIVKYREVFDRGHEARYRGYFKTGANSALEVMRQRTLLDDVRTGCGF